MKSMRPVSPQSHTALWVGIVALVSFGSHAFAENQCTKTVQVTKNNSISVPANTPTKDVTITVTTNTAAAGNCTTPPTLSMGSATIFLVHPSTGVLWGAGSLHLQPKPSGSQPQNVTVTVKMNSGNPLANYLIKHEVFARFSDGALRNHEDGPFIFLEEGKGEEKGDEKK